jgi:hypothetical protein
VTPFLDLFSGIDGFALGAYWAGLRFDKHYFSWELEQKRQGIRAARLKKMPNEETWR